MATTEPSMPMTPLPDPRPASGRGVGNFRWVICGLLFLSTMINYMDRQVTGVLKPLLSHDLRWTEKGYADIVTAFQFAYALATSAAVA